MRPTGSYWGGGGENIDMRSGNLNFTIPLLKVKGRGWNVPFNLSYNSQNWRHDSGGTWNLGQIADVKVNVPVDDTKFAKPAGDVK